MEDDEAGRLAGFRARYGSGFDSKKADATTAGSDEEVTSPANEAKEMKKESKDEFDDYEFEDDDASLLDLISSYGQENSGQKPGAGKRGGK